VKNKTNEFKFEIDLKSNLMVGSIDNDIDELSMSISNAMKKALVKISENRWIDDFSEQLIKNKIVEAYFIFEKNKELLQFVSDKTIIEKLRKLNVSLLNKKQRKDFLSFLIAVSGMLDLRDNQLEKEIDFFLDEYEDELEIGLILNLKLEKANISASNGHYNQAIARYKKLLSYENMGASIKSWIYRGLSKISNNNDDYIRYSELAIDTFLVAGNKKEAIKDIVALSDFESKIDVNKALKRLNFAIDILGTESLVDKEFTASLKHKKAQLLYDLNILDKALREIEEACNLRRGLIANELYLHASVSLASLILSKIDDSDKKVKYDRELLQLSQSIKDENFLIRQELSNIVSKKENIPKELIEKLIQQKDNMSLCAVYIYMYTIADFYDDESIALIDKAIDLAKQINEDNLLSTIYLTIADKHNKNNSIEDAFVAYKKSLEYNPFNFIAYQNGINMLFKNKRFKEVELFLERQINFIGELPNICFYYAKALFENEKYQLALKYFKKSNKSDEVEKYMLQCIMNDENNLNSIEKVENNLNVLNITLNEFKEALEEFSISICQDSRMYFWKYDKEKKKYKWTEKPEELSKQLLINFLNGKFGVTSIEILQEPRAGAGFIDLYILLAGGLKVVIELKMCGAGYSLNYAISGKSQVVHYAENKNTNVGFLIVLDSRTRDYGKSFQSIQSVNNIIVHTIVVDVRSIIEKKSVKIL
jgi:hypothetical protein